MILKKSDPTSIEETVRILRSGGIVILPTDTVYGFSGIVDLQNVPSLFKTDAKIRAIKGRQETKPLIQLLARPEDLKLYTDDDIPPELLAKWPGALTIIVHIKKDSPLADSSIPATGTVAFRCPGDAWLRQIISLCEAPVFSTSVNRSGLPVLDTRDAIVQEFSKETNLIIDDGDKKGALPSTLVALENGQVRILRHGSVKL
jgi:L-threonylcarbamoyladenylate synthase